MEQQFKIRQIEDALRHPDSAKEDIITVFLALQRQTFCLTNSLNNLLKHWPREQQKSKDLDTIAEVQSKYGTSFETND